LGDYTEIREFNGAEIRALESHAEALVSASHAIYKERIYTLNDFFTVDRWGSEKTAGLAKELRCENALKFALILNRRIRSGLIEAPYRVPVPLWLAMLLQKLQSDDLTRATSTEVLKALTRKNAGKLLISKLTRETY